MSRKNEASTSAVASTNTTIIVQNMYAGNVNTGLGDNNISNAEPAKKKNVKKNKKPKQQYNLPKNTKELLNLLEKCHKEIDNNHGDEAVKMWKVFKSALDSINIKEKIGEDEEICFEMTSSLVKKFFKTKFSEIAFELNFWRAQLAKKFFRVPTDLLRKLVSISYLMNELIKPMKLQEIEKLKMAVYFQSLDEILRDMYKITDIDINLKTTQIAWYLAQYGFICFKAKLFSKALQIHTKGITLMEFCCLDEAEHFKVFGHSHVNAAVALEELGSFEEAKNHYEIALKCYEKAKDMDKNEKEKKIKTTTNSKQKLNKID